MVNALWVFGTLLLTGAVGLGLLAVDDVTDRIRLVRLAAGLVLAAAAVTGLGIVLDHAPASPPATTNPVDPGTST